MPEYLEIRNLSKQYAKVKGIDDVSFSCAEGSFTVLLGPSGAGKTTTLQIIAGILQETSGDVLLFAPPVVATMPLFIIWKTLKMLDTYPALFLSYILINMPFAVWIMKGFFEDIPHGIENAALLDGYSRFHAFRKYVLPLAVPGIAVTALFVFIFSWNEFLFALIFTRSHTQTLPITLAGMTGGHEIPWGEISALSLIAILPGVILTLFFQKYLVRGLTFGAVKG